MKNTLLLLPFLGATFFVTAQNVGIGTPTPDAAALLHVQLGTSTTKGFLITGTFNGSATIPNLGYGSRMMFYPGKTAFRAGFVDGTHWDNANVGTFSTAMGTNTIASGDFSTAMGFQTTASGYSSLAMGTGGQANSAYSIAIGESVTTDSWNSISLGRQNDPIVTSPTIGWVLNEPLLIVGNGTGPADKKNAFAIAKNGNIHIDPSNKNDGTLTGNTLLFGTFNGTGEGISSKRTAGGNQNGLDFYTGSTNRMSISNGGNVGIGTSTPGFPLNFAPALGDKISLFGNSGGHYGMGIQNYLMQIYTDAAPSDIAFGYGSSSSFTERMRIKNGGETGIELNGRIVLRNGTSPLDINYAPGIWLTKADNSSVLGFIGTQNNQNMGFYGGPGGWGFIYDAINSRVGIGTTTPINTLDVTGNAGSAGNFVNASSAVNSSGVFGSCASTPDNGYGIFGQGGRVGVSAQASLAGAGDRFGVVAFGNNGTGTNYGVFSVASGGTNTYGIYSLSSGASSNYGLYGNASGGTNTYGVYGSASGATTNYAGYFVGNVLCSGTYFGSDRKLKNDIKPLSDAMSIINQLKPSVYTFKTNEYKQMNLPEGLHYGLIADEVQQVVPGAVKKAVQPAEYENHDEKKGKKLNDEVTFNAVNYTEMIPILIAAMKEQQVMIEELKIKNKKIDTQQLQIDELKKLVEKLTKQ